jgi:hypothetical protein
MERLSNFSQAILAFIAALVLPAIFSTVGATARCLQHALTAA